MHGQRHHFAVWESRREVCAATDERLCCSLVLALNLSSVSEVMCLTHFLPLLSSTQVRACISNEVVIKMGNLQQLLVFEGVSTKVARFLLA